MEIFYIISLYACFFLIDFSVFKSGCTKEKIIYLSFFCIGFIIIFLTALHIKLPNPSDLITSIVEFIIGK